MLGSIVGVSLSPEPLGVAHIGHLVFERTAGVGVGLKLCTRILDHVFSYGCSISPLAHGKKNPCFHSLCHPNVDVGFVLLGFRGVLQALDGSVDILYNLIVALFYGAACHIALH